MTQQRIKVLVAEDSMVIRLHLVHLLEADPDIQVVGAVADGRAAVAFVHSSPPDVVLMDLHMPHLDGFEATRRIMETTPVPIVICSATSNTQDIVFTFQAMEAGAIACIEKPLNRERGDFEELAARLLDTVKLMSEVKVVRRSARAHPIRPTLTPPSGTPRPPADEVAGLCPGTPWGSKGGRRASASKWAVPPFMVEVKVIGMGASTGGPLVLQTILEGLPLDFPAPLLVVQHIAHGFLEGMVEWLNQTTGLPVHLASDGATPLPGHVYLAPDDVHMGLKGDGSIILTRTEPENHLRPAVSFLFRSLAETCGPHSLGVLLTGMGRDGADELRMMRERGAITIAQDRETSVVHGMPGEAIALGAATHVLAADKIAEALVAFVNPERS